MKVAILAFISGFIVLVSAAMAWSDVTHSGRPGSINYVEGQASIDSQILNANSAGFIEITAGQTLTTQAGKVEVLLTPGVFLRLADNSSLKMISPALANTEVELNTGRAIIEAIDVHKETFHPGSIDDLPQICTSIAYRLKNEYVLGYKSSNSSRDGRWRNIRLKLRLPSNIRWPSVRFKPGYYAPNQ